MEDCEGLIGASHSGPGRTRGQIDVHIADCRAKKGIGGPLELGDARRVRTVEYEGNWE